jgi:hypothetical protein
MQQEGPSDSPNQSKKALAPLGLGNILKTKKGKSET